MKRSIYHKLCAWKAQKKRKPLILNGVRQCGKTFILEAFGRHEFPRTHYFNFEKQARARQQFEGDLEPSMLLDHLAFLLDTDIHPDKDLVIFDEIQACPSALTSLKYFAEEMPELAICSAGSLLGVTLNQNSFPVGKVDRLQMCPMSYFEFLEAIGDDRALSYIHDITPDSKIPLVVHEHLWERLKHYFIVGGLPEVVSLFAKEQENLYTACQKVRSKQNDIIKDYFADMAKHAGKNNAMHIHRVWESIPNQLARAENGGSARYRFKDVLPNHARYSTLAGPIDWLKAAGLLIKVPIINTVRHPLAAYTKENIFKLYMFDVGILGALSELSPATIMAYDYGTYKGYFAENHVAQSFLYQGIEKLFCWEGKTAEIEFVHNVEGSLIPIEVKSGQCTRSKSLYTYTQKFDPLYQVVMSARAFYIDMQNKRHHYPLYLAEVFPA